MRTKRSWADKRILEWCIVKIWRMIAESWEWISLLKWWAPENQTEKTPELLRMGEKNSHNRKQLWGWHEARTMNLQENGPRFRGNTSSVFTCWEWWREPPKLLRHFGSKKNRNDEPTMKIFWKRSWIRNMTDENSFLRQTLKSIWNSSGIIRRVR